MKYALTYLVIMIKSKEIKHMPIYEATNTEWKIYINLCKKYYAQKILSDCILAHFLFIWIRPSSQTIARASPFPLIFARSACTYYSLVPPCEGDRWLMAAQGARRERPDEESRKEETRFPRVLWLGLIWMHLFNSYFFF